MKLLKLILIYIINITIFSCVNINKEIDNELVTVNHNKISPSGSYELILIYDNENYYYYFKILGKNNNMVYINEERFYRRHALFICWDEKEDIVWCYSGDIGTYYWINENNEWKKHAYFTENIQYEENENNITPPKIFKKLRPNRF